MRTITIEKTLFKFSELDETAKQKAIDYFRQSSYRGSFWFESVYEDAAEIADLFGLDLRQTRKQRADGTPCYVPTIYFSGFYSQGDGACFEATYRYKKGGLKAVVDYAPNDSELHSIVSRLRDLQRRNFYQLTASTKHGGHYHHSGCMSVDVERLDDNALTDDAESGLTDLLREFADWIYSRLESEYDYQTSDDTIRENIESNEYEFDEEGNLS